MNNEHNNTPMPQADGADSQMESSGWGETIKERKSKMISVKGAVIIAAIIVLLGLAYYFKGLFIAASVNGSPISRFAVIGMLEEQSGRTVLDSIITERLIRKEAQAKGVTVPDEEINAEITKIETQITAQGSTLEDALAAQGATIDDVKDQIMLQKLVEKLLAERTNVTDEEVQKYITDNKVALPKGQEAETRAELKEQLKSQKLSTEGAQWISELRDSARVKYYVNY